MADRSTAFTPDPLLSEHSAEIELAVAGRADRLQPGDLASLMDSVNRDIFRRVGDRIKADSGAIWLLDRDEEKLVVGYAHPLPELLGREQALDSGLISLVIATENSLCENQVYQHRHHSKRIDEALGKTTCAMIAVPLGLAGATRGVISFVQWKDDPGAEDPCGFSGSDLATVAVMGLSLERLLNYQVLKSVLDLQL